MPACRLGFATDGALLFNAIVPLRETVTTWADRLARGESPDAALGLIADGALLLVLGISIKGALI